MKPNKIMKVRSFDTASILLPLWIHRMYRPADYPLYLLHEDNIMLNELKWYKL